MKCQNCNFQNDEKTIFCKNCGERLVLVKQTDKNEAKKETTTNTENNKTSADNIMFEKTKATEGCVGRAWKDIQKTENWIKKLVLAGLTNIIPIVNFATTGYAMKWGAKAAANNNEQLEYGIFENQSIKTGFFEWVAWLAYGFVFFLGTTIINSLFLKLFLIGWIIGIAIFLFGILWNAFVTLGCMKQAIDDKLSSSFEIKNIWNSYKTDFWKILCAYLIPALICNLIAIGFSIIVIALFATGQVPQIINLIANAQYVMTSANAILAAVQIVSSLTFCLVLCYAGYSFMTGIEKIIRYRAIGIYINSTNTNWAK